MDFDCYQSAEIALTTAQYSAALEKKSRLPDGTWALGTGAFLRFELLEHREQMKRGDIAAILRYRAISAVAVLAPRDRIDPGSLEEIMTLLKEARKSALSMVPQRLGELQTLYRKAALSMQKDLYRLRTVGA
jgi:hypothetical protein